MYILDLPLFLNKYIRYKKNSQNYSLELMSLFKEKLSKVLSKIRKQNNSAL